MRALGKVVVGYDTSGGGRDALALGELVARTVGGRLLVVRVARALSAGDRQRVTAQVDAELEQLLAGSPLHPERLLLEDGSVPEALHSLLSRDTAIGTVAVGSTHRAGLGRVLPGGVAERLLDGAPCSVAVAPRRYADNGGRGGALAERPRVIAVAFDGSPESRAALQVATELATAAVATMRVIAVGTRRPPDAMEGPAGASASAGPHPADLQADLLRTVEALPAELRALPLYERGQPAYELLSRAEEGVHLLVMGSRGHGPLRSVLLGTTSRAVIASAPCPVIVVPRPALAEGTATERHNRSHEAQ